MHPSRSPPPLFTLRLWQEPVGDRLEWRGEIKNVSNGETRYFREWHSLIALISRMLEDKDSAPSAGEEL